MMVRLVLVAMLAASVACDSRPGRLPVAPLSDSGTGERRDGGGGETQEDGGAGLLDAGGEGDAGGFADATSAPDAEQGADAMPADLGLWPDAETPAADSGFAPDATSPDAAASDAGSQAPRPPVAVARASVQTGVAPLTVQLDATQSSDPDGDLARFEWRFGDGTPSSSLPVVNHTFQNPGSYRVELEVVDATNLRHVAALTITVTPPAPGCPTVAPPVALGNVTSQNLPEISGAVASRRQPGIIWVHNDSGGQPRVYAISRQGGVRAGYVLNGAQAVDWEDIAIGPGPVAGQDYLYVGDIGDNSEQATLAIIYRVQEPTVPAMSSALIQLGNVETIGLRYANNNSHNAEALLVDPTTGDIIIFTKSISGQSAIYRASPPFTDGQIHPTTLLGVIDFTIPGYPGSGEVTGGDISTTGDVLIRTYYVAYLWRRPNPAATFVQTLNTNVCLTVLEPEPQGESIAFRPGMQRWYTLTEGQGEPVYEYTY